MLIKLKNVENEYRKRVETKGSLTVDEFINIALTLFKDIKIEGIDSSESDNDMLLYQYGVYDWGDENGKHFSFDITRQVCVPQEDEPYQLSFTLIFEPSAFFEIEPYNCWSDEFDDGEAFAMHIKSTSGYQMATKITARKVELRFDQC